MWISCPPCALSRSLSIRDDPHLSQLLSWGLQNADFLILLSFYVASQTTRGWLLTLFELYPTYLYKEHNKRVLVIWGLISIMNMTEPCITCLIIERNYYYLHSGGVPRIKWMYLLKLVVSKRKWVSKKHINNSVQQIFISFCCVPYTVLGLEIDSSVHPINSVLRGREDV